MRNGNESFVLNRTQNHGQWAIQKCKHKNQKKEIFFNENQREILYIVLERNEKTLYIVFLSN